MFRTLDLKYYKIEVNDEIKETKCTQIINPSKKKHWLNFWNKYWIFCSRFEIEKNHKVQYDYDNNFFYLNSYIL
jgi:hypothetical protein